MTYEVAKQRILAGENVFISGAGGVGKSHLIKNITTPNTVLVAPTGIAALNIGGSTAHRTFKLPIGLPEKKDYFIIAPALHKLFGGKSKVDRIIFDEVGMLRADTMDLINAKLQNIRGNKLPFGGIQTIMVGDFLQLEPIVSSAEEEHFYEAYETPFAFGSEAWNFPLVELTHVYRQEDTRQVAMLNSIRWGDKYSKLALHKIQEEASVYENTEDTLHLCCYKESANRINQYWYNLLQGQSKRFKATYEGKPTKWTECPVEEIVELKVGCRVVICANDSSLQYFNGNKGVVLSFHGPDVLVRLECGRQVLVTPNTWDKHTYSSRGVNLTKEVESSMKQIPLLLGYAITVHKSQGMTLDKAAIDVGRGCFSHGQLYVSLSRIKDLRNLSFVNPINPTNIIVRQEVVDFYDRARQAEE